MLQRYIFFNDTAKNFSKEFKKSLAVSEIIPTFAFDFQEEG